MHPHKTLFPLLAPALLICSCFSRSVPSCDGSHQTFYSTIGKTHKLQISYFLETGYRDVSGTLLSTELIGPDKINRYVKGADTVTLSWYYNQGVSVDTATRAVLEKLVEDVSPESSNEIEPLEYEEFTGYVSALYENNNYKVLAFGTDIFSRVYLLTEFSGHSESSGAGQVKCLLQSLHFR